MFNRAMKLWVWATEGRLNDPLQAEFAKEYERVCMELKGEQRDCAEKRQEIKRLRRQVAALRGTITRLKAKATK